ncbi:GAF domain-containing protein [Halomarina pelagica]|uniref:GAF domain-containing protein n=1 Tax=Halomarina pelagica TaxID=2961599 RepID=UPI0020C4C445|nr:GAF domain-containing protein [Halomarina sp. BND7]
MSPPDDPSSEPHYTTSDHLETQNTLQTAWQTHPNGNTNTGGGSSFSFPEQATPIQIAYLDGSGFAEQIAATLDNQDDLSVMLPAPDELIDSTTVAHLDCIVSEYDLPNTELTGLDILEAVRHDYPHLPFLLFTGSSAALAERAIDADVTAYLRKDGPDQTRRLAHRIKTAVKTRYQVLQQQHSTSLTSVSTDGGSGAPQREQVLATLRETTHQLFEVTTKSEMSHIAVDAAREVLAFPIMGIHLYEESSGSLQPAAGTTEATELFDGLPSFSETGTPSIAWRVFAEGEPVYMGDVTTQDDVYNTETPIRSEILLPLGDHGVMIIGLPEQDAFTDEDIEFAELLATYVESAFDRIDQTQQLQEHRREVQHLTRLQTVMREIEQAILEEPTRSGVEQAVCDRLTAVDPYAFAWISEPAIVTETVTPRTWAHTGEEETASYLTNLDIRVAETVSTHPASTAFHTGEVYAHQCLADRPDSDDEYPNWCQELLTRGYQATCAVPLTYSGTTHGVLTIDAVQPHAFDDQEQEILAQLGETIGYAMTAIKRREALISEGMTELEFNLTPTTTAESSSDASTFPLFYRLAANTDSDVTLDRATTCEDGAYSALYSIGGTSPEEIETFVSDVSAVLESRVLAADETQPSCFIELTLSEDWFGSLFYDRGAVVRASTADCRPETEQTGRLIVELPPEGDVRLLAEAFEQVCPTADLVARRDERQSTQTLAELEAALKMTDRQREVLETAYYSGYFETPRETTGEELADGLDIAQSTLNKHLRVAERKALSQFFERDS